MSQRSLVPSRLKGCLTLSTDQSWKLALTALIVLWSRAPFIANDYGNDPDAFRVANAAAAIAESGRYSLSRPPSYPVHELATALVIQYGPLGANGATALMSVLASSAFALILQHLRFADSLLLALALAFTPVVYVNSTCAMDYVWALAFILFSLLCLLTERTVVSGVLLGVGIGCRLTSGAMLLPFLVYTLVSSPRRGVCFRRSLEVSIPCLLVGTLCYVPSLLTYGLDVLTFSELAYPPLQHVLLRATAGVWGSLGFAGLLLASCGMLLRVGREAPTSRLSKGGYDKALVSLCFVALGVYSIAYLRLPHEAGYLVPAVPFAYLLLATFGGRGLRRWVCVVMLLAPFISIGRSGVSLSGPILEDYRLRLRSAIEVRAILETVTSLGPRSVVVSGWWLPKIKASLVARGVNDRRFIPAIENAQTYEDYVRRGYSIFFLPDQDAYNEAAQGFSIAKRGAKPLSVVREMR